MIVERFVSWCETASSTQRVQGTKLLVRALTEGRVPDAERKAADEAMLRLAQDPSTAVRRALAEAVAETDCASDAVVSTLARDVDSVAAPILATSLRIADTDLIDHFADGSVRTRAAILDRPRLSIRLCAAIAELSTPDEAARLLAHPAARIAATTLARLAERHGDASDVRGGLLARADLPVATRQTLILASGEALQSCGLVIHSLGRQKARRLTAEACEKATAILADSAGPQENAALVEHLLQSDQLSVALLLRFVCDGQLDIFSHALARLAGVSEARVRPILAEGRARPFASIAARAGLPADCVPLFVSAIEIWREIAETGEPVAASRVPERMMNRLARGDGSSAGPAGLTAAMAFLRQLAQGASAPVFKRTGSAGALAQAS
ncbi:Uncharacterized conserved protein, DUF2336 family [Fulvimarina manganoxydans]|uniref:Uncharacterized conserved protein, DUF2336 family n=1 Tax=Fulvimarina manganoxydans TaxID=937218 RepID=A0A1W2BBI6_9HYPH|nr:DUF2336 domain-containing protein [Fulvimarina manganoxydans]SMC70204.1 Uncharacterized conserved protein, DUF2336 family [Fulvimarina manganoxydans]